MDPGRLPKPGEVHAFHLPATGTNGEFDEALARGEILLDCLPGKEAPRMARLARQHDLHYTNLTEHVEETEEIQQIAAGASRGFLLQTGLAPGYVNVLGHGLYQRFCQEDGVDGAERIEMRVGALTTTARPPHFYGFTWSPSGVATEYIKPATVLRDHQRTTRPSLSERCTVVIDGITYEEDLTSGGAADLPAALEGKVRDLDYKTLRYPGHYDWIERMVAETPAGRGADRLPAGADGSDRPLHGGRSGGDLRRGRGARRRRHPAPAGEVRISSAPAASAPAMLKAIQTTTTAGLAESARLLLTENPPGGLPAEPDRSRPVHGGPVCCRDLPPLKKGRP